jgi:hypothetical protein
MKREGKGKAWKRVGSGYPREHRQCGCSSVRGSIEQGSNTCGNGVPMLPSKQAGRELEQKGS